MNFRPDQNKSQKGWLYVAAFLAGLVTLSCSLATRSFPQILNSGAPPGLIVYIGTDGNIYTIDREGKNTTAITQDANSNPDTGDVGRIYQYPTWSPNSRRLAFISFEGASPTDTQAVLYTASLDGMERVEAFKSQNYFPFYLSWSPNSEFVTFLSNGPEGFGLALHMAAIEGGNSQLIGTGQPYYLDWSPDSRVIIAHTGGAAAISANARLVLFDMDGTGQKTELDLKPGFFQAPAWSPDGEELVLATGGGEGGEELVLTGREGEIKRVLAQISGPVAFAWSPDGEKLAYTTSAEEDPQGLFSNLILLDPARPEDGEEAAQGIVVAFFWSPDSRKIAYLIPDLEDTDGISRKTVQDDSSLRLKILIYDLSSGDTQQVAAFEPTDAFLQILPFFDQYQRSSTIWSPDSRNLVLSAISKDGVSQIFVVRADGSQSLPVAEGNLAFWSRK